MRLLDGARQCDPANIGRKFRELGLIELVAAIVQKPDRGMREDTPIALQILEPGSLGRPGCGTERSAISHGGAPHSRAAAQTQGSPVPKMAWRPEKDPPEQGGARSPRDTLEAPMLRRSDLQEWACEYPRSVRRCGEPRTNTVGAVAGACVGPRRDTLAPGHLRVAAPNTLCHAAAGALQPRESRGRFAP